MTRPASPATPARRDGDAPARVGTTAELAALDGDGPVWLQIRRALAAPILAGTWPPGTQVPIETELSAAFGAARMTVNRALQSLVADGLVRRQRKRGTFVAERVSERPVFEVWDVAELVARSGAAYGYRLLSSEVLGADDARREPLEVPSRAVVVAVRCLHLADGRPFQLEERLIHAAAAPGAARQSFEAVAPGEWLRSRVPWTDAEHRISAQSAPPEVATALALRRGSACLVVDRRTWNGTVPVTHARLWHPGHAHALVGRFGPRG